MKTDIEKIGAILKAVGAVTFTDGKRTTAKLRDEWFLSSLTSDLNAIRELELMVIEKFGAERFWTVMQQTDLHYKTHNYFQNQMGLYTADAATRIAAMLAVIEEAK